MKCAACLIILAMTGIPTAEDTRPDLDELVEHLDRLYRSDDSYSEMTMTIETPNWTRTLTMKAWSRGTDRTFIRILSPARDAGMATLRIDDQMWNYLPNTNSTVRVPPSMMSGSWMGSDITNNDIVREITYEEGYTYSYLPDSAFSGDIDQGTVIIELVPRRSTAVVWSSIVIAIRLDDLIPLWERYYDSGGDLIRTITFSEVQEMGGRTIPTVMEVVPADEEGNRTNIRWTSAEFDRGVGEDTFTLRNLQSGGTG
ncbi:MAG: outer membrane lipoprotein-sorting protein [Candidatus Fermentibacteraceae bacterium]|nr:outer membrane lipoprotein-sorting protein [Candidatus Fermentibacteraceae bacterium]MBN2609414.1 outer membrane lipoprotein-sorting protein [Candidatus Fermentibacteraceae bacterium]